MANSPTRSVELDADLLERVQHVAEERGVAVPQVVQEALEHELAKTPSPKPGQRKKPRMGIGHSGAARSAREPGGRVVAEKGHAGRIPPSMGKYGSGGGGSARDYAVWPVANPLK